MGMGDTPASFLHLSSGGEHTAQAVRSGGGPAAPGWEGPRTWVSHWPAATLGRQGGVQAGPLGRRPLCLGWAPDAVSWASVQTLQTACRCPRGREGRPSPCCSKDRQGPGWSIASSASPVGLQPLRDCDRSPLTPGEPVGGSDVVYPEDGSSECPPLLC